MTAEPFVVTCEKRLDVDDIELLIEALNDAGLYIVPLWAAEAAEDSTGEEVFSHNREIEAALGVPEPERSPQVPTQGEK